MKLTEDMKRVVEEQKLGFIATVCPDGTPNLSPKGTTTVWDDEHLVFADVSSPRTMRNLRANPAIEINVVDPIARLGYRFKGRAEVVTDGPLFERAMAFYEGRMTRPRERARGFAIVAVEQARPLRSPAYDLGLDEAEIRVQWEDHYRRLGEQRREGDADRDRP